MRRPTLRRRSGGYHLVLMFCVLAAIGALAAAGSSLEDPESPVRAPAPPRGSPADGETLTMAFARRPRSLDPAFATDRTSTNLLLNIMDPLVRLNARLQPVPSLVRGWEYSDDGRTIRFTLNRDAHWRNGEPVTADDIEFAWKRVLSPELDSPVAQQLFAVEGAAAYHACMQLCSALEDAVGIRTLGRYAFEVRLAFSQPWFVATLARPAFLPVSRSAVARYGDDWAEPGTIVTDGAFALAGLTDTGVSLVKNPTWRAAATVALARVEGVFVTDSVARVQAFDEGRVQALDGSPLPETDLLALAERREYEAYPSLQTWQVAFNLTTISDVHQRRAMAAVIDRRRIIDNVVQHGETPAERFVTDGLEAVGRTAPASPWMPEGGDVDEAKAEFAEAETQKTEITLLYVDAPGNRDMALALRDAWNALGIETTVRSSSRDTYMDFRGPLGKDSVDVYQLDVPLAVPDAGPALDVWTCASPRNKTTFCNGAYDRLIERARQELDPLARTDLYTEADLVLSGTNGQMPGIPLLWPTYTNLEALSLQSTFTIDPLGRIDLAAVRIN